MRKNHPKFAIFMIVLVMTIPFYTANVFAEVQIDDTSIAVSGTNEVDGFVAQRDMLNIYTEIITGTEDVFDAESLLVGSVPFDECTDVSTLLDEDQKRYACSFTDEQETDFVPGPQSLSLSLFNSDKAKVDDAIAQFFTDTYAPQVTALTVVEDAADEELVLTYSVKDTAIPGGSICSGISMINIYSGETEAASFLVEEEGCLLTNNEYVLPISTIGSESGTKSICMMAVDGIGLESELMCKEITIDNEAPVIDTSSLVFLDEDGLPVEFFAAEARTKLSLLVADDLSGVNYESVKADLSSLAGEAYDDVSALCFSEEEATRCEWNDIPVIVETGETVELSFYAEDNAGNNATASITFSPNIDDIGPSAISFSSLFSYADSNLLGLGNNVITVTFDETGAGLYDQNVYLDLSAIGGGSRVAPTNCTEGWTCTWEDVKVETTSGTEALISITSDSTDDLGNPVSGESLSEIFYIDRVVPAPDMLNAIVTSDSELPMITSGDYLQIIIPVIEWTELTAVADVSALVEVDNLTADMTQVPGRCEQVNETDDGWLCFFEEAIGPLKPGKFTDDIVFTFTDSANNSYSVPYEITVYGEEEEIEGVEVQYMDVTVGPPSPKLLDRHLMGLTNMRITYPIEIYGGTSAVPVQVEIGECQGDVEFLNNEEPYQNKPRLILFNEDMTQGALEFSFDPVSPEGNDITFNCSLNIISLVDNERLSVMETHNLDFEVGVYYPPLGELSEGVWKKIDGARGNIVEYLQFLDVLEKILKYAQIICSLINTLYNIVTIFSTVVGFFGDCCASAYASQYCCPAHEAAFGSLTGAKKQTVEWYAAAQKYCGVLRCKLWKSEWIDGDSFIENWYNWAADTYGSNKGWMGNVRPEDSLPLSIAFLCLPGIIYNLQKMRQVQCQYIGCLLNTQYGLPPQLCDEQRDLAICKYVVGEIFNLIPFAAAFSDIALNIRNALRNPFELIGTVLSSACSVKCGVAPSTFCSACTFVEFANLVADTLCDLGIGGNCPSLFDVFDVPDSYCSKVMDQLDKYESGLKKSDEGNEEGEV